MKAGGHELKLQGGESLLRALTGIAPPVMKAGGHEPKLQEWESLLKEMFLPPIFLGLLDICFVLLLLIMLSSNYVFLPGIKGATLPVLPEAEIVQANKLIVTILQTGEYVFNGQKRNSWQELENSMREALERIRGAALHRWGGGGSAESPVIVLRADRNMPYHCLVDFFAFARSVNAQVFLVTASGGEIPAGQLAPGAP